MTAHQIRVSPIRKRLAAVPLRKIPHLFTDVLIIGGGIAGIRAALALPQDLNCVVVTKDRLQQSNSTYAQGGIAGVLDPLDDFAHHVSDTMAAGKGLCHQDVVEFVVREAPDRIRELICIGTEFDRVGGEIALTLEGGHSHARVAHAMGDATGQEIMRALHATVHDSRHIDVWQQTFTVDLLEHEGVCRGALVWNGSHGRTCVWAKQTVVCTGGAGALYRETTNPAIATGDGHAICFRAGCVLRDMEFMQFHPTVLYIAGSSRHLITEAVRGEGAHLLDCDGRRFMKDYDDAMELAPRDVVSQAITRQMVRTRHPCVYLDLTPIGADRVRERFPGIGKVCSEFGLDITRDRIPVRPGAHYMLGGVATDHHGRTSLPGLWAAGEVSSTGLHGANRLASNSLLEGLVFGLRAGAGAAAAASAMPDNFTVPPVRDDPDAARSDDEPLDLADLRNSLRSQLWRGVGISRDAEGLAAAQRQLDFWANYVCRRELHGPEGWELQNMLLTGRIMAAAALARQESRGVHFRSDFPESRAEWERHVEAVAG